MTTVASAAGLKKVRLMNRLYREPVLGGEWVGLVRKGTQTAEGDYD